MIVALCADKGSPGVTTATLALAMAWPGQRVVLEADPSGGDLAFRSRHPATGGLLAADPGLLTLAADARTGLPTQALGRYAQATLWGVDVIVAPASVYGYVPMRSLWPAVAGAAASWPGVAIADLGRLSAGSPAIAIAQAATAVLVVTRVSAESLYHLRDRMPELTARFGDPSREVHPVAVVTCAPRRHAHRAAQQVERVLAGIGSPVPVLGNFAVDPPAAQGLRLGQLPPRTARGALLRSAAEVSAVCIRRWPELAPADAVPVEAVAR